MLTEGSVRIAVVTGAIIGTVIDVVLWICTLLVAGVCGGSLSKSASLSSIAWFGSVADY